MWSNNSVKHLSDKFSNSLYMNTRDQEIRNKHFNNGQFNTNVTIDRPFSTGSTPFSLDVLGTFVDRVKRGPTWSCND